MSKNNKKYSRIKTSKAYTKLRPLSLELKNEHLTFVYNGLESN